MKLKICGLSRPNEVETCINNGNEALDGKSITAWHRVNQFLKF